MWRNKRRGGVEAERGVKPRIILVVCAVLEGFVRERDLEDA
jgi:hypothetical protein